MKALSAGLLLLSLVSSSWQNKQTSWAKCPTVINIYLANTISSLISKNANGPSTPFVYCQSHIIFYSALDDSHSCDVCITLDEKCLERRLSGDTWSRRECGGSRDKLHLPTPRRRGSLGPRLAWEMMADTHTNTLFSDYLRYRKSKKHFDHVPC